MMCDTRLCLVLSFSTKKTVNKNTFTLNLRVWYGFNWLIFYLKKTFHQSSILHFILREKDLTAF